MTARYRRVRVDSWASRLADFGGGAALGAFGSDGIGSVVCGRLLLYRARYGDLRYSPAQSLSGSASNAWKTSAHSRLPKWCSPSAGVPKYAILPPGTRTSNRSQMPRLATEWVTTM